MLLKGLKKRRGGFLVSVLHCLWWWSLTYTRLSWPFTHTICSALWELDAVCFCVHLGALWPTCSVKAQAYCCPLK